MTMCLWQMDAPAAGRRASTFVAFLSEGGGIDRQGIGNETFGTPEEGDVALTGNTAEAGASTLTTHASILPDSCTSTTSPV
mmetsp:Transcript_6209/g.14636  ORF Transcript_6209/g.14636 Transcript_6209/m.14636 type:complete len:81 (-) Transcript_6209:1039-1281(-)